MGFPAEVDFVVVQLGDGATPEVFTTLCGIDNASINRAVNTSDRFRRDCAKPGSVPSRKVQVQGTQVDVTGSGVFNIDQVDDFTESLGIPKNYRLQVGKRDGTDTGDIVGHFIGPFVMTAYNVSIGEEGTAEITLASDGAVTWVPAV